MSEFFWRAMVLSRPSPTAGTNNEEKSALGRKKNQRNINKVMWSLNNPLVAVGIWRSFQAFRSRAEGWVRLIPYISFKQRHK